MINLFIALGLGVLTSALLYLSHLLKLGEAIVPGVIVVLIAYFVLARRTFKQMERIAVEAAKFLQSPPPKFDAAINQLQKAYPLAKKQFGIKSQIDGQIGMIYFLNQDFNKALPYLKKAQFFGHWMTNAMLGVVYYKKKEFDNMRKTMDFVVKRAKSNGLAWNLYAYLLQQIGDKPAALNVLAKAMKATKEDAKIKEALLALQNDKKFKMRVYKEQWYQFHLEKPPMEQNPNAYMGRPSRIARRGRW